MQIPGAQLWMKACHHALVRVVLSTVEGSTVHPLWTQTRLLLRCAW